MNGFSKVIIVGNLTRDPELRYLPNGTPIAKFGLAINRKWKDQSSGEMKEEVTFVDVDAFGKHGETIGQYLKKGRPILVEGRLRTESWEDKQSGQKRSRLGVVLEAFTFLDSGNGGGGAQPSERPPSRRATAPTDVPPEKDDVPF